MKGELPRERLVSSQRVLNDETGRKFPPPPTSALGLDETTTRLGLREVIVARGRDRGVVEPDAFASFHASHAREPFGSSFAGSEEREVFAASENHRERVFAEERCDAQGFRKGAGTDERFAFEYESHVARLGDPRAARDILPPRMRAPTSAAASAWPRASASNASSENAAGTHSERTKDRAPESSDGGSSSSNGTGSSFDALALGALATRIVRRRSMIHLAIRSPACTAPSE